MTPGAMATTPMAVGPKPTTKSRRWWLLAIPVLGIGLIAMLWPLRAVGSVTDPIPDHDLEHHRVTRDPGLEFQPAISPDGSEVAYVGGPIGNPRVVVRSTIDIGGGGVSRPSEADRWTPLVSIVWTPDGASVRFWAAGIGDGYRL